MWLSILYLAGQNITDRGFLINDTAVDAFDQTLDEDVTGRGTITLRAHDLYYFAQVWMMRVPRACSAEREV